MIPTLNSPRDGILAFLGLPGGRRVAGGRRWPSSPSTPNLYTAMLACSTGLMLPLYANTQYALLYNTSTLFSTGSLPYIEAATACAQSIASESNCLQEQVFLSRSTR
ncbi:unnamed protein product [Brassica oleracea]